MIDNFYQYLQIIFRVFHMKKYHFITLAVILFCLTATQANAQWALGLKGGWTRTTTDRTNMGRIDESYSSLNGYDLGIQAHYSINYWMAVRVGFDYMKRSHRMDRNLNYVSQAYTEYRNDYLMIPVMADFSFGGKLLRGHLLCGGFGGYWLKAQVKGTGITSLLTQNFLQDFDANHEFTAEDQRFTVGVVGGVSLTADVSKNIGINIDALYYYDLVSYQKDYVHLKDPRYLDTFSLTMGVYYKF